MEVSILATPEQTRSALDTLVADSRNVKIAAAFVRASGVEELQLIQRAPEDLKVLAGTDFGLTQVQAIETLHAPPRRECRLFLAPEDDEGVFHPKLYLGQDGSDLVAVVGSSNLTRPALTRNVELNVFLAGKSDDQEMAQLASFFSRLWNLAPALSADLLEGYRSEEKAREELARLFRHSPEYRKVQRLVQNTLTQSLTSRPGKRWLLVTSEENYLRCKGRSRWGDENYSRISKIQLGDIVIFYIKRIQRLGAVGMVTRGVYRSAEHTWTDREYPFRVDFTLLLDPPAPIDFIPFIPRMDFLPRKDAKWGTALQTSSLELPQSDANILVAAIQAASRVPTLELQVAEEPSQY